MIQSSDTACEKVVFHCCIYNVALGCENDAENVGDCNSCSGRGVTYIFCNAASRAELPSPHVIRIGFVAEPGVRYVTLYTASVSFTLLHIANKRGRASHSVTNLYNGLSITINIVKTFNRVTNR